jgi:hypothetical protein
MSNQNPNLCAEPVPDIKDIRVLCMHLFDPAPSKPAHRCASPALRGETFCYYHHPTRRPLRETRSAWRIARREFSVPTPTDREQLLDVLTVLVHAVADNRVKLAHARRILYSLQQVGINLQKAESATSNPPESSSPQHSKTTTSQPDSRLYNQQ